MTGDHELSYILNALGEERELYFNAGAPPIVQTSNFCFKTVAEMRNSLKNESEIPFYTRGANPTTDILRKKMAALEKTEDALIFSSGSAAISCAVMACVEQGDHIVCVNKPYSWTNKLLNILLKKFGVTATMIDGTKAENFEQAIIPKTKLFIMESPNSWTFELQDMEAVVSIAKKHGVLTLMDNSYCTPLFQRPAEYGVDIIAHSATKYICGHSDAVAGVICTSKEISKRIFEGEYMTLGPTISPFNSALLLRGLRTLPIRMQRVSETAQAVVNYLAEHPKVEKVYYPFHRSHPQFELAKKQMKQGAGQFTITLKTDDPVKVERFCNSLQHFLMACSWGSYESLIFPAITLFDSQNYKNGDLPMNMIRLYVGLEDKDFLINDLENAFQKI
jgi:cystathionine beta-lyase/cystathionine gamma-synthase